MELEEMKNAKMESLACKESAYGYHMEKLSTR